jgi:hypothetical protein
LSTEPELLRGVSIHAPVKARPSAHKQLQENAKARPARGMQAYEAKRLACAGSVRFIDL